MYNKKGKSETRGGCMVDVDSNKGMVVEGSGEDLAGRTGAPDQAEYCRGTFEQVTEAPFWGSLLTG